MNIEYKKSGNENHTREKRENNWDIHRGHSKRTFTETFKNFKHSHTSHYTTLHTNEE